MQAAAWNMEVRDQQHAYERTGIKAGLWRHPVEVVAESVLQEYKGRNILVKCFEIFANLSF